MNSLNDRLMANKPIPRFSYKQILLAALQAESFQFARYLGNIWLEKYPGDLEIQYILSRIIANEGDASTARAILERISAIDPEFIEAQEFLAKICEREDEHPSIDSLACVYVMGRTVYTDFTIPDWSFIFRTAWQAYLAGQFEDAEQLIRQVIVQKPNLPLASILHHRIVEAKGNQITAGQLAMIYHERFPACLYFKLLYADLKMENGEEIEAIEILHDCVINDSGGIVLERLWGKEHRYWALWPDRYEIEIDSAIPAEVASYLGLNNLPEGQKIDRDELGSTPPPETLSKGQEFPEETHIGPSFQTEMRFKSEGEENTIQVVDEIFEKLAKKLKQPELSRTDGRFPVYVILSLKTKLIEKYGRQTYLVLDTELQNTAAVIRSQRGWGAAVIYPDDPASMVTYGLTAVEAIDPWEIKKVIVDLDESLSKKGEMIGALLIVGGGDVVPFHHLPNPTDDLDEDVPSDNPYASMDGNYFVQEWPVGRLPDEEVSDAGFLLAQIRLVSSNYTKTPAQTTFLERLLAIFKLFNLPSLSSKKSVSSLGYSAAIWQRASRSVYRNIGNGQKLLTSPPEYSGSIPARKFSSNKFAYFNLHGLQDSAEWYGQKELGDASQTDYPVALTPTEISKTGSAPSAVFSEACYGGYISGKTEGESIALKYLGLGTGVFIGSTCVSYGSIDTPLIGADLLAQLFWRNIQTSSALGEAFIRAKLDFVKEMEKRQGFLDGEDQKTLLSFIYFGDPLFSPELRDKSSKRMIRRISAPKVNFLSDDEELVAFEPEIPAETIQEIKKIAEIYLPGLEELDIHIAQHQMVWEQNGNSKDISTENRERKYQTSNGKTVITVRKSVPINKKIHHHYLRARLGQNGALEKVAISR